MRQVDKAVESANDHPRAVAALDTLLRTIESWKGASSETNPRRTAVGELEGQARARRDLLAPIDDVPTLLRQLWDSRRPDAVAEHPQVPDLFGRLEPPPVPAHLVNEQTGLPYDYSRLSTDEGVEFLRNLDIRLSDLRSADMDPTRWHVPEGRYSVAGERETLRWAPDPSARELAEKRIRMPQLVHAIWLGAVPTAEESSRGFWRTLRANAGDFPEATFVLWTDVTRDELQDAEGDDNKDSRHALHLRLLSDGADEAGIVLVNVDEVYNASRGSPTTPLVQIERAKRSGPGWAAASDILRVQIVSDFGGMYVDGGDRITTLADLSARGVVSTPEAFAVDYAFEAGLVAYQNNVLVAPPRHPLLDHHIAQLVEHYQVDQATLYQRARRPPVADTGQLDLATRTRQQLTRRHSVLMRTGPDLTAKVLQSVGYRGTDVPRVRGVEAARGQDQTSWLSNRSAGIRSDRVEHTGSATLTFTQDMISTALRSLAQRDGDLDLYVLDAAISRHSRPELVWEAVFEFLRTDEGLRHQVRAITRSEWPLVPRRTNTVDSLLGELDDDPSTVPDVVLPPRVAAMLEPVVGEARNILGRRSEPVRLRPPTTARFAGFFGAAPPRRIPSGDEWVRQSTVHQRGIVTRRSAKLAAVDDAVRSAHRDPFTVEPLEDLLHAIETWRAASRPDNPRAAAIDQLESTARARRERLGSVVDHEDLLALLRDSYQPAVTTSRDPLDNFVRPAVAHRIGRLGLGARDRTDHDLSSGPAMLAVAQDVVVTALRDLAKHHGTLDMLALDDALVRHPRHETIWTAAFGFLQTHDHLRTQVRAITSDSTADADQRVGADRNGFRFAHTVPLQVWAMFVPQPEIAPVTRQGRRSHSVRLRTVSEMVADADLVPRSRPGERQLPTPPVDATWSEPVAALQPYRPRPFTRPLKPSAAYPPVSLIHRPVPGVTQLPSISRTPAGASAEVNRQAAEFTATRFPGITELNSVRGDINCSQAVVAVDLLLEGNKNVRIPLSGISNAGIQHLHDLHDGEWVPVSNYDDIIERMSERPGSRGVVWYSTPDTSHVFNAVHTTDGVVFLDGQSGGLADLVFREVTHFGLMRYQPRERPAIPPVRVPVGASLRSELVLPGTARSASSARAGAHVVTDQRGTQWASSSRSARDAQGNLIPDAERACVEVTLL